MNLLFLDIDGVLNDHQDLGNGYSGISKAGRECFNMIMDHCPDVQVVISSAWRYHVHNGEMSKKGLEELLLTHGLKVKDRIHGITEPDPGNYRDGHWTEKPKEWWHEQGLKWRKCQIQAYISECCTFGWDGKDQFVVIDDLPLEMPELVHVATGTGMNQLHAIEVIERFGGTVPGIGRCESCGLRLPLVAHSWPVCEGCYLQLNKWRVS